MASRRKKISLLGTLAIAIGAVAWFSTRTQVLGEGPVVIGACGVVLGLLAMIGSSLLGNTGKFIPLAALLVCGSAIGFGMMHNATGAGAVDQLRHFVDRFKPAPAPAPAIGPILPVPSAVPPSPPMTQDKPAGSGSIFDMTPSKGSSSPQDSSVEKPSPPAPTPTPVPIAAPLVPAVPAPDATQRYADALAAVTRAHAKLDAATAGLIPALSKTDAYQTAKTDLDAADVELQAARANGDPGNAELTAASLRYVNAKTAVQKLINEAAETDPQAVAAKQELIEAQGDLRAAKEEFTNARGAGKK